MGVGKSFWTNAAHVLSNVLTPTVSHSLIHVRSAGDGNLARPGRWRSRALLLAGCLTVSLAPTWAHAAAGDQSMTAAMNKFDAGRKAFEAGQFEEALIAFQESSALSPSPNSKLYIARCYRALGKVASAYTTYRMAARESQDRLTASGEKRYGATRDFASSEAAEIEPKVPRLTIAVPAGVPEGFVVKAGGEVVAKAGWGVAVETDPGDVTVEATGPRVVPFKKTVKLDQGAQVRVDVEAKLLPTATVAVKLLSLPSGLALTLDNQPLDVSGASTAHQVDIGPHTFVATAPGYVPFKWTKDLVDTEAAVVEVTLTPDTTGRGPSGTPKWLFFTVAGAAVVSLGAGAGIAAHAESQQSQQTSLDPFVRDSSVQSSIKTQGTINDVLFIGGGVLAAGAVALVFTTRWKTTDAPSQGMTVAPWFVGSAGGVGAHGSF
jgi:hypothetical protein